MDWDDAYANGKYIAGADAIAAAWPQDAAAFRNTATCDCDIAYGSTARERLDLFHPARPPKGLFVFIHGGYWMAFGKSDWSHFAQGALDTDWAVAIPGYDLCPDVTIVIIGEEIARAVSHAAELVDGPIVLCGHSAGGHLVARLMCGPLLPDHIAARVRRVVGISGIYDLRPLRKTQMNDTLGLATAEAQAESPALLAPRKGFDMVAWVGAEERPAFLDQSDALKAAWAGHVPVKVVRAPGRHHFNVIDDLRDAQSDLMQHALAS